MPRPKRRREPAKHEGEAPPAPSLYHYRRLIPDCPKVLKWAAAGGWLMLMISFSSPASSASTTSPPKRSATRSACAIASPSCPSSSCGFIPTCIRKGGWRRRPEDDGFRIGTQRSAPSLLLPDTTPFRSRPSPSIYGDTSRESRSRLFDSISSTSHFVENFAGIGDGFLPPVEALTSSSYYTYATTTIDTMGTMATTADTEGFGGSNEKKDDYIGGTAATSTSSSPDIIASASTSTTAAASSSTFNQLLKPFLHPRSLSSGNSKASAAITTAVANEPSSPSSSKRAGFNSHHHHHKKKQQPFWRNSNSSSRKNDNKSGFKKAAGGGGGKDRALLLSYTRSLKECSRQGGQWRKALGLMGEIASKGIKPDLICMNILMDVLAKGGRWRECLDVLKSLPTRGLLPDVISFNTAIHACARRGQVDAALSVLTSLVEAGVQANARTYGAILDACRRAGDWSTALRVLREMTSTTSQVSPTVVHYSVVIDACLAAGQADYAFDVLKEMTEKRGLRPDLVVYTSLAREEGRAGKRGLVALIQEMEAHGVKPDEKWFAGALEGAARGGKADIAWEALGLMKERGIAPGNASYTGAMRALSRAGLPGEAWKVFETARGNITGLSATVTAASSIKSSSSSPLKQQSIPTATLDLKTYTAGLVALAKEGRATEAKALINEMIATVGLNPDPVCHQLGMEACCRAGRWTEALGILRGPLRAAGPVPTEMMIKWLGKAGLWGEALRILQDAEEASSPSSSSFSSSSSSSSSLSTTKVGGDNAAAGIGVVTVTMYRESLRACAAAGRGQEAKAILTAMIAKRSEFGLTLIGECEYAVVMDALINGGRPLEAVDVLGQMEREEFGPRVKAGLASYNAGLKAWAMAGRVEEVVKLLGKMISSPALEADAVSFNTAVMACARAGDWKLALDIVRLMEQQQQQQQQQLLCANEEIGSSCKRMLPPLMTILAGGGGNNDHNNHPLPLMSDLAAPLMDLMMLTAKEGKASSSASSSSSPPQPDILTYNALLQALIKAHPPQPLLALNLFEILYHSTSSSLHPDPITFNLAIIAAGQAGQPERALGLLRSMTVTSATAAGGASPTTIGSTDSSSSSHSHHHPRLVTPSLHCITSAISACYSSSATQPSMLAQAERLLREAEGMGIVMDAAAYACLMTAYNRRGAHHRVLRLYRRMRKRGVEPSASALTQVMLACRRNMDATGMYQALRIMRSKGWGLRPERGLYQAALTACYCEGDDEMGRGLREEAFRLHGIEVGGEEEVVERAVKWGISGGAGGGSLMNGRRSSSSSSVSLSSSGGGEDTAAISINEQQEGLVAAAAAAAAPAGDGSDSQGEEDEYGGYDGSI